MVGNDAESQNSGFAVLSGGGHQTEFSADVTNWSWYPKAFRLVGTCTDRVGTFPFFHEDGCNFSGHCNPLGDFGTFWASLLLKDFPPGDDAYAQLVPRAFCWRVTYPGCIDNSAAARGLRASAAASA